MRKKVPEKEAFFALCRRNDCPMQLDVSAADSVVNHLVEHHEFAREGLLAIHCPRCCTRLDVVSMAEPNGGASYDLVPCWAHVSNASEDCAAISDSDKLAKLVYFTFEVIQAK